MPLPTWISPQMKGNFGKMFEELMLFKPRAVINLTIYGVTIIETDTQNQYFAPIDEWTQESDVINSFLTDDSELFQPPITTPKEPVVDLTQLLNESSVDEQSEVNTTIPDPNDLKPEDIIDFNFIFDFEEKEIIGAKEANDNMIKASKESVDSETWKNNLTTTLRRIHTENMDQIERTILYYKIGTWITNPPTKFKFKLFKVKEEINKSLGFKVGDRPYSIARNTHKIFNNEEQIRQQRNPLSIHKIRRMTNTDIKEFKKNF